MTLPLLLPKCSKVSLAILILSMSSITHAFGDENVKDFTTVAPSTISPSDRLANSKSWHYQLQSPRVSRLTTSPAQILVIDYSRDGTHPQRFRAKDLKKIKSGRPDRLVLSYLSIGEAEEYRYYWESSWKQNPPTWLAEENPNWGANHKVQYWNKEWQSIILGYLEQIILAGFDGVYLDIVDAFEYFESRYPKARQKMIHFLARIKNQSRRLGKPDFLLISQNGDNLCQHPEFLAIIDGMAREDLYFGIHGDGKPNLPDEVLWSLKNLRKIIHLNKPVFLVEYGLSKTQRTSICHQAKQEGFKSLFAERPLINHKFQRCPQP